MAATDYDFNLTRNQIINSALKKVGVLSDGQVASGTQLADAVLALNVVLKSWQNKGIFLWTHKKETVSLVANDKDYTFTDNNVISIDKAYYTVNNIDYPVSIISWREYEAQVLDKEVQSDTPEYVALNWNNGTPTLYVYPEPSTNISLKLIVVIKQKDMETADGYPAVPENYLRALIYDLVTDLQDDYPTPLNEKAYTTAKARSELQEAKKRDIEHSDMNMVQSAFPKRRGY